MLRKSERYLSLIYSTAVAPGTVPTVPLFWAGTANRTTISTEKNNFEMKKDDNVVVINFNVCLIKCYKIVTNELPLLYYQEIGIQSLSAYLFISIN